MDSSESPANRFLLLAFFRKQWSAPAEVSPNACGKAITRNMSNTTDVDIARPRGIGEMEKYQGIARLNSRGYNKKMINGTTEGLEKRCGNNPVDSGVVSSRE